jgi:Holliday junction resolvase RusA-like endonuclease
MGIDPRKLPKELRDQLGIQLGAGGHVQPKLMPALPAYASFLFKGDPPRATHHAKQLARRGTKTVMVNSPELEAAWAYYLSRIPERRELVPIAGPITADVTFHFEIRDEQGADVRPGAPMGRKPDRDNACKVLFDALAERGWIANDSHVTDGPIRKRWAAPGNGRVMVYLRTLSGPADRGDLILPPNPFELFPVPWLVAEDVAIAARQPNPPGSSKRPRRKSPGRPKLSSVVVMPERANGHPANGNGHPSPEPANGR